MNHEAKENPIKLMWGFVKCSCLRVDRQVANLAHQISYCISEFMALRQSLSDWFI
jgi:hypothetical protein